MWFQKLCRFWQNMSKSMSDLYQIRDAWGRPAEQAARAARPRRKTTNWVVVSGQNAGVLFAIFVIGAMSPSFDKTLWYWPCLANRIQGWRCFNSAWSTWDTISKMRQSDHLTHTRCVHVFWVQLHQLTPNKVLLATLIIFQESTVPCQSGKYWTV